MSVVVQTEVRMTSELKRFINFTLPSLVKIDEYVDLLHQLGIRGVELMKEEAPSSGFMGIPRMGGGRYSSLKDSIKYRIRREGLYNFFLNIVPLAPWAIYVMFGTRPSRGRYVPYLSRTPGMTPGKRLINEQYRMRARGPRFDVVVEFPDGTIERALWVTRGIGEHPGQRANPFHKRAFRKFTRVIKTEFFKEVVKKFFK